MKAGDDSRYLIIIPILCLAALFLCLAAKMAVAQGRDDAVLVQTDSGKNTDWDEDFPEDDFYEDDFFQEEAITVSDPLEPANRIFFKFNDRLYFWFFKPVSKAYGDVVPSDFRLAFYNCFNNLKTPVSMANCFLQGKFKAGSVEAGRFLINSTVGILGLADAAKEVFGLDSPGNEDLGQTMGYYGIGDGIYFCWPLLGPSTLRDTVGRAGDYFIRPVTYALSGESALGGAFFVTRQINNTSLRIGEYEEFLEAAFDPYLSMRDAYIQRRVKMIKE